VRHNLHNVHIHKNADIFTLTLITGTSHQKATVKNFELNLTAEWKVWHVIW
jgi:hypothetical protein